MLKIEDVRVITSASPSYISQEGNKRNPCNAESLMRRNVIDLITLIDSLDQDPKHRFESFALNSILMGSPAFNPFKFRGSAGSKGRTT